MYISINIRFPSKTTIGVGPLQLMPAHRCTLPWWDVWAYSKHEENSNTQTYM